MNYLTEASLAGAIRAAISYNRNTPVLPKALVWTDFPDTDDDLFGPGTKDELRPPNPVRRRRPRERRRLYDRLITGEVRAR